MNLASYRNETVLRSTLNEIIEVHGRWPVLKALLTRRYRASSDVGLPVPLDDHLRRDIGLPPLAQTNRLPVVRW